MRLELVADDAVVPLGVARRAVDHVDEHAGPLDVAQERVAEPGAAAGALDEARDVGDRRPRSSSSPRSMTPRFGSRVVNGVVGDLRRGGVTAARASTCRRWAARPGPRPRSGAAPGGPTVPCPVRPSARASVPRVDVLKCVLPSPPRPPRATITCCPAATRSASSSPLASSSTAVPGGTPITRSGSAEPWRQHARRARRLP